MTSACENLLASANDLLATARNDLVSEKRHDLKARSRRKLAVHAHTFEANVARKRRSAHSLWEAATIGDLGVHLDGILAIVRHDLFLTTFQDCRQQLARQDNGLAGTVLAHTFDRKRRYLH